MLLKVKTLRTISIFLFDAVFQAIQTYKYLLRQGMSSHLTTIPNVAMKNATASPEIGLQKESTTYFLINLSLNTSTFVLQKAGNP